MQSNLEISVRKSLAAAAEAMNLAGTIHQRLAAIENKVRLWR